MVFFLSWGWLDFRGDFSGRFLKHQRRMKRGIGVLGIFSSISLVWYDKCQKFNVSCGLALHSFRYVLIIASMPRILDVAVVLRVLRGFFFADGLERRTDPKKLSQSFTGPFSALTQCRKTVVKDSFYQSESWLFWSENRMISKFL